MPIPIQEIKSSLKKELGSFFSTEAHKDPDMIRYINSAVRYMCDLKPWDFNKYNANISITDTSVPWVTKEQIAVYSVYWPNWTEVDILNFEDYHSDIANGHTKWFVWCWDTNLYAPEVWSYNIIYAWYPDTINTESQQLDVPYSKIDIIICLASYYAFMDVQAYQKAAEKRSIATAMVEWNAVRNTDRKPKSTPRMSSNYRF